MILSHTGQPQTTEVTAITIPAKPIIDPTDRSNSPAIMRRQAPTAIIINCEDTIPQFIEPSNENMPVSRATKKKNRKTNTTPTIAPKSGRSNATLNLERNDEIFFSVVDMIRSY